MQVETLLEQLFFTTVFIGTRYADGRTGSGTGFIYNVETGENQFASFVVTNKHVIEAAASAQVRFIAGKDSAFTAPLLGQVKSVDVPDPANVFTGHPDDEIDVAVVPVTPWVNALHSSGEFVFYRGLTSGIALNSENVQALDALEEVTFVGYPNGLFDQVNFLPIARRGYTATPPSVDYGGKPTFLIDASVFPGSSGSPVLIAQTGSFAPRGGGLVAGQRVMLLGVVAAVYQRTVPVMQVPTRMTAVVQDAIDIGIVYKAEAIDETVDVVLGQHGLHRHTASPPEAVSQPDVAEDPLAGAGS